MDDLLDRFSNALHGTAHSWHQALDRRLKTFGTSQAGWMAITVAAQASTPLSQSALAEQLGVEGATMVAMVDRLVKAGLVVRESSTTDRRVKRVIVTEAGRELYERVKAEAVMVRRDLLEGIDRSRLETATHVLAELQAKLSA